MLVDRAIAYFAPRAAVRRQLARAQLGGLARARAYFEGATTGNRANSWRVTSTDANNEWRLGGNRLRDVARDMVRNHAYSARAKSVIVSNTIGTGIIPSIQGIKAKGKRTELENLMAEHFDTTAVDAAGLTDLYGLQALAMGTIVESGECLVRLRPRKVSDGLPLPFQIEVLEPDYLDNLVDGPQANGNLAIQGVEFDGIGRRVAYHILRDHPGSTSIRRISGRDSTRVPAELVAHCFRVDRAGQARGISWFAPVILRMKDFHEFADTQLLRQKVAACFAAFVYADDNGPTVIDGEESASGNAVEGFEPGMVSYLRPGEKVEFANPPAVGDFDRYSSVTLHEIAAGLGVSYEALTGDLTGVNFSSGRMGWLEFQRNIATWRAQMLIPQMLAPVSRWFLQRASIMVGAGKGVASIKWTSPRREMISPRDEVPYQIARVRAGFVSRSELLRQDGYDPEHVEQEIADEQARADDLELIFDTDPRQRTASGNAVTDKATDAGAAAPGEDDGAGDGDRQGQRLQ